MDARLSFAVIVWLALLAAGLFPVLRKQELDERGWRRLFGVFCVLMAVALPLWRWRSLTYEGEINVDEGTGIALALKYLHDPVPWRSVDGITCGPLSTWVALWAPMFGVPLSYFTLRFTAILLIFASISGLALCLREILGRRFALLGALPALTLLLTSLNLDFVTFALEYLPMALSAWVVYFGLRYWNASSTKALFAVGLITGSMPFSKLQAAPSAVLLFLICAALVFVRHWRERKKIWPECGVLAAGGLTVPALILIPVIGAGAWTEFLNFYIFAGASYQNPTQRVPPTTFFLEGNPAFGVYLAVASLLCVGAGLASRPGRDRETWAAGFAALGVYTGVMIFSVLRSGFPFPHYLLLMVLPVSFLLGWALRGFLGGGVAAGEEATRRYIALGGVGLLLLSQAVHAIGDYVRNPALMGNWGKETNPVVPVLQKYAQPGDSMMIWGWNNKLHAFTGIRPSTRFIGTTYLTDPSPNYNRHREIFLQDLKKDRPKLFVDAVDEFRWPSWPAGAAARHDMLPELASWIRSEYSLVADVQTAPNRLPVRIYVRKNP
jgi:hypothetical protein